MGSGARGELGDDAGESREGLRAVVLGAVASASLAVVGATRIAAAELAGFFQVGSVASSGYSVAWSLALLGAGHLVGLSVGMAMLTGLVIAWGVAVPWLTSITPVVEGVELAARTGAIWSRQVRFIGAGAIAVAAIYTLARLSRPVLGGLIATLSPSRTTAAVPDTDRDISPPWIFGLTAICIGIATWLAWSFVSATDLASSALALTLVAVPFVLIVGFVIAGICGYMAGLIGASNSPDLRGRHPLDRGLRRPGGNGRPCHAGDPRRRSWPSPSS